MTRWNGPSVLLGALAACLLGALVVVGAPTSSPDGLEGPAGADSPAAPNESPANHPRDKRRLPDPGFIVPAQPMGFVRRLPDHTEAKPIHSAASPEGDKAEILQQPKQAERKMSPSSSSSGVSPSISSAVADSPSERSGGGVLVDSLAVSTQARHKKASASILSPQKHGHARAIAAFLDQTRKLGVSDEQALQLLDRELAKAKRQQHGGQQQAVQRPVYHATPLRPHGSLINFNEAPYEKYQLKDMKPIKEQQQDDIPPPDKPIVVESGSAAPKHTQAVIVPSRPLPVSVPMQLDPPHLLKAQHGQHEHAATAATGTVSLSSPLYSYQTVALPPTPAAHSYQQMESEQQDLPPPPFEHNPILQSAHLSPQSVDHNQIYQTSPDSSEASVPLGALHSYLREQHTVSIHPHQVAAHTLEQAEPQPVYVYRDVKLAQQAQPHASAHAHTEIEHVKVVPEQGGLYDEEQTQSEEYASQYRFGYRVHDEHGGSDFGHAETREGHTTKGEYFVTLPDGRLQNVKYWAGPDGFHAHVSYTNHGDHGTATHHP